MSARCTPRPKAGDVKLKVPKLRRQSFETAIIERYQARESSVEEALIEMYLAGVSVRRVEDITEASCRRRAMKSVGHAGFALHRIESHQDDFRQDR